MCKSADEPGGPRRCAAEARTHYQRSAQRVAELEREYDRLTAQLDALTAQRESVVGDIDEQGAVLFEQLTGHRPVTITNTLGHEVTTSFTVGEHTPSVNLRWSGRQKWGAWHHAADLDAPIAHALAVALEHWKNSDRLQRIKVPHGSKEVSLGSSSKIKNGAALIVIDMLETDAYRGSTGYLDLDRKAIKRLAAELKIGSQQLLDLEQEAS
ncbi:hypothetical protein A5739_25000 [Mycobacterium colombiense]|uniref:hypothetical protein n=1 Tax=Mycobacterium colombiense TaxID=339268 RepID=UPI00096F7230|nr:hypothetical protein [Mycobacterium colombiense]OMC24007.1 hypothetical protein A5739_25000 [Mycobacterium colombiense]